MKPLRPPDEGRQGLSAKLTEGLYQKERSPENRTALHRFAKIPKCRCRRFSPTARGRSAPCGALLPSPGVKDGGMTSTNRHPGSCYENVGENTDDWRTPQDAAPGESASPVSGIIISALPGAVNGIFYSCGSSCVPVVSGVAFDSGALTRTLSPSRTTRTSIASSKKAAGT